MVAQQVASVPAVTGSITGHVVLGDSRLPARMAWVTLIRIIPGAKPDAKGEIPSTGAGQAQTLLDGSFTIPHVVPGSYYVMAEKAGYVPIAHISASEMDHPTQEQFDLLAARMTPTLVVANQASAVNITLAKGATIAGEVHFDDGSADSATAVSLLHRDKSGRWAPFADQLSTFFRDDGGILADDQGHFRISGLPAGEYLLRTSLELGGGHDASLDVYFGDVFRQRDAKVIKVGDGEESVGHSIEIPLAKLHTVSGSVVSVATGTPVNSAHVELRYADDDTLVTETNISPDWEEFHFAYVPEGEYTLKVRRPKDTTFEYVASNYLEKTKQAYSDASQPIVVHGEVNGVTIQVKPTPQVAAGAAQ